jgi:hypothetical protein
MWCIYSFAEHRVRDTLEINAHAMQTTHRFIALCTCNTPRVFITHTWEGAAAHVFPTSQAPAEINSFPISRAISFHLLVGQRHSCAITYIVENYCQEM